MTQDIIVGTFDGYVRRLRPDGSEIWNNGIGTTINALLIDSKTNIIIGKSNTTQQDIISVNNENVGTYLDGSYNINCLAMQSDGKILVGHSTGILRLNTNYTIDDTLTITSSSIKCILVLEDDSFWAGNTVNETYTTGLSSYTSNGVFINPILSYTCNCLSLYSDTQILLGTDFGVYRFNTDRTIDSSWITQDITISTILVKNDTEIWVGDGGGCDITVLDHTGNIIYTIITFDFSFLLIQEDDKVLRGKTTSFGIDRYNADYSIDTTFSSTINYEVVALILMPILIPTLTIRRLLRTWRLKIPRDKKNIGTSESYNARIRNVDCIVEFIYGKNSRNTLGDKKIVINDISIIFMV